MPLMYIDQEKSSHLHIFVVVSNCTIIFGDFTNADEIHEFIERDYQQLKENVMLKQQLR